jgi:hypothetical protein
MQDLHKFKKTKNNHFKLSFFFLLVYANSDLFKKGDAHVKKKLFVILFCALIATPLFAGTNMVGIEAGPSINWASTKISIMGIGSTVETTTQNINGSISGVNYFGAQDNLGVGYALGFQNALSSQDEDGNEIDVEDTPTALVYSVTFQYKKPLLQSMQLEFGIGLMGNYQTETEGDTTITASIISLIGSTNILYSVTNSLALRAGLKLETPVSATYTAESDSGSISPDVTITGIEIYPFIGVSYIY